MHKLIATILLAGSALAAPPQYTPQQIKDCVALQYLLNPPPSVEIEAVYWTVGNTNDITWSMQGEDWQGTQVTRRLGDSQSGFGNSANHAHQWLANTREGWGNLLENETVSPLKEKREQLHSDVQKAERVPLLGLSSQVDIGDLILHQGKLINRQWLNHPNLAWSMGEITLDSQGRLSSIRWRAPDDFRDFPERHFLIEYSYTANNPRVDKGLPTSWMRRLTGEHGPGAPEMTQVLAFSTGAVAKPERASPDRAQGIKYRDTAGPAGN